VQEMKRHLGAENFVAQYWDSPGRDESRRLAKMIHEAAGDPKLILDDTVYTFNYAALTGYAAAMLQPAYAHRFANMSEKDIDRVMQAFKLENCKVNDGYIEVLKQAMK